jgi:hypothetical protein
MPAGRRLSVVPRHRLFPADNRGGRVVFAAGMIFEQGGKLLARLGAARHVQPENVKA